jgi:hypothetical protein
MGDYNYIAFQEIGKKLIYNALSNAQFAIAHSNNSYKGKRYRQGIEDLQILSNGELEKMIDYFNLDFDPENIKIGFYYYVKKTTRISQ